MDQPPLQLRGAGGMDTAQSTHVFRCTALFLIQSVEDQLSTAGGAHLGHGQRYLTAVPFGSHAAHDLGDNIARLLDDNRISDADVPLTDDIQIVQRCPGYGGARQAHGRKFRCRRQNAGTADLEGNSKELGLLLLGRIFISNRPLGGAASLAQNLSLCKRIDLDNGAVDVVRE